MHQGPPPKECRFVVIWCSLSELVSIVIFLWSESVLSRSCMYTNVHYNLEVLTLFCLCIVGAWVYGCLLTRDDAGFIISRSCGIDVQYFIKE